MTRIAVAALTSLLLLGSPCWAQAPDPGPAPADDDGPAGDDADADADGADEPPPVDPALRERIDDLLYVDPNLRSGDRVDFSYFFGEPAEQDDFVARGLDIVDVKEGGLLLGAGSRGAGTAIHKLPVTGDFVLEVEMVVAHNTPSAVLCLVLSKKIGISWGQAICKPKSLRPYRRGAQADPTLFREERTVRTEVALEDGVLTVKCNGRKVDARKVKKGDLKEVRLGFLLRNIRLNVKSIRIKGLVDRDAL